MGIPEIALIIGLLLSFLMAIALGGNDAATSTGTVVGTGVLGIKRTLILFAIFAAVGALTQGFMVMKTTGTGIVPAIDLLGAIIVTVSAFVWIMFCNFYGLEISVTHAIIGGILGYGMAAYGINEIQLSIVQSVVASWFISPLLAAFVAFLAYKLLMVATAKYGVINRAMPALLTLSLCYSAYAFGTNNIANATGVYVTVSGIVLGGSSGIQCYALARSLWKSRYSYRWILARTQSYRNCGVQDYKAQSGYRHSG